MFDILLDVYQTYAARLFTKFCMF